MPIQTLKRYGNNGGEGLSVADVGVSSEHWSRPDGRPVVKICTGAGRLIKGFFDTGANVSLVKSDSLEKFEFKKWGKRSTTPDNRSIWGATGDHGRGNIKSSHRTVITVSQIFRNQW